MPYFTFLRHDDAHTVEIPLDSDEVMPGIHWGDPCALFTPAYWYTQALMSEGNGSAPRAHRIGNTFEEEVTACLLGGYGIPAEVGLAAFKRLRSEGIIRNLCSDPSAIQKLLREPLEIGERLVQYRFWHQKSEYLANAYSELEKREFSMHDPVSLRNQLLRISGIGPKTASWIVRNWLDSDEVAILDIHIVRAGLLAKLFSPSDRVARDYASMENRFICFASALSVRTSYLDALIWATMRMTPRLVMRLLHPTKKTLLRSPSNLPMQVLLPLA
ncbi:MAG: 8-oxoguanine DNA glycosylase [Acidobacteria bacterium]|nr:MAG: 8-oxoguanine DNA glycosylase [Acidobacteriota bacterium]